MAILLGLLVTAAATPVAAGLSRRLGLVDHPGAPIKVHGRPVARGGGLALAAGLAAAAWVLPVPGAIALGAAGVILLGLLDDRFDLPPASRLSVEAVLAAVAAYGVVGPGEPLRLAVGVLVLVVAVNAANMLDGLDGLLAGSGALSALGLALVLSGTEAAWMAVLAASLLGFLAVGNRPPARVFLGDGGSYLVGLALGSGLLAAGTTLPAFLGGVLMLGVIGGDFLLTLARRTLSGRPLFRGDRSHAYDQLRDRGLSLWGTIATMWVVHACLIAAGLLVARMPPLPALALFGGIGALGAGWLWRGGFVREGTSR